MILLDTHAWVWWLDDPERLSPTAKAAIDAASEVVVSAISAMEVAALVRLGRLGLDRSAQAWVVNALTDPRVVLAPIDSDVAVRAGALPEPFPGDPADRAIYATAVTRGVRLVTRDKAIRQFDPLRTVW